MITLAFTQKTAFNIASLPEKWRENVTVLRIASLYLVSMQIYPDDNSYRYRALMQKPQLVLKFSLPFFIEFPVGTTCVYQNQRFILTNPENLKRQGHNNIEYTMTLGTNEDYMSGWKFRNTVDRRLKFSLCAKPHEFIEEIVKNLNARDKTITWEVGECIESAEKTVEFNHVYIDAALTDVANVFETEYEVEYIGTTTAKIHLRKVEYFKEDPVALSYGRGNGFVPGIGRASDAGGAPVKRMYVQGSNRNIDRSKYGAPELLLPKSQTLEYEGRTYQSDADGYYIERIDTVSSAIKDDSLDCSEIYPSRVGTVSSVIAVKPEKNYYDIIDNTIPSTLNFNDYLIAGESMTIIFQSGMLSGKEFDVKYKHDERRFEIVPQEIDGVTMPNATYCPEAGQEYAIFGIMLPNDYICNNTEKTGASWDMFRAAAKALYECEDQKFTFSGQLQSLWTKRNWLSVGGHLVLGGYVLFTDNQFAVDGVKIRIVGIKDYVNKPYSPTIELSNSVTGASLTSTLREINNTEIIVDDTKREIIEFTKRRFRDAKETIEMLEDAMLDNFTHSISPITVQTMAMLVGDEALQFQFIGIDGNGNSSVRADVINYNQDNKQLTFNAHSAGMDIYLQHLTLGINSISSEHKEDEYKKWKMKSYTSPVLTDGSKRYYLYAKCYKTQSLGGELLLSENAIKMDSDSQAYHFLVGVLNTESNGERSFATLYGFTEILPGRITTDRIVSADGKTFFDLANSTIGGRIDFQDGLISGLIGIGNELGINAGMSGAGNAGTDIRFWAGATTENSATAPFRVTDDGSTYQTKGQIGKLKIDEDGLHYGDVSDWSSEELKTQIKAGRIRLQNKLGYNLFRLGLGDKAEKEDDDTCFMHLYKQYQYSAPQNIKDFFQPAIKLDCRTQDSPMLAMRTFGSIAIQQGSFLEAGYIMDVTAELPIVAMYRIDIMNGTTQVLRNTSGNTRTVFLDFRSEFLAWTLNTQTFAIKLTVVAHKNNNGSIKIVDFHDNSNEVTLNPNGIQKYLIVRSSSDLSSIYILRNNNL